MSTDLTDHPECRTPLMMAAYRARATARYPFVNDPWAAAMAGEEGQRFALEMDRFFPSSELWLALRTAYIDRVMEFLTQPPHDLRQVVLLGSPTDTRPWRFAGRGLRFFETSHPVPAALKRARLEQLTDLPETSLTALALDFQKDDFIGALQAAGLSLEEPTLFVMEGSSYYIAEPDLRRVLRELVTRGHPRSLVLFDYVQRRLIERSTQQTTHLDQAVEVFKRLRAPFRFATDDMLPLLYDLGYRYVRTVNFDELALMFEGTWRREREFRYQGVVLAGNVAPIYL